MVDPAGALLANGGNEPALINRCEAPGGRFSRASCFGDKPQPDCSTENATPEKRDFLLWNGDPYSDICLCGSMINQMDIEGRNLAVGLLSSDMDAIRHTVVFGGLGSATLNSLIDDAAVSEFGRGEMLFLQGEPADHFFVVLDGWIKVYRMTSAGEEAVVGIFTRGQNFAEAAAFTGGVFPASAEAVTNARILHIPARRLFEKISKSPEIGLAMLASTSQHLHLLVRQVEQLKAHTGAQRVAEFLVSLAPGVEGPCIIALPFDKTLLAGKLGLKPESLSRAFHRLKPCGVTIERDKAIVNDISCLVDFKERERAEVMRPKQSGRIHE